MKGGREGGREGGRKGGREEGREEEGREWEGRRRKVNKMSELTHCILCY